MDGKMLRDKNTKPVLGIIVPCYNEENILLYTKNELLKILKGLEDNKTISSKSFVAFVNDGSTDKTWDVISKFHRESPERIKGLKLSGNFGHQNALLAGMISMDYDICVTIDADLQDAPETIIEMIDKYHQGYEIVYGVRQKRSSDSFFKRTTAQLFYTLMKILGVKIIENHADFRLLSKRVVNALRSFKEVNIFLRGIVPFIGFKNSIVHYERQGRKAGTTKYPLRKMLPFAWEGITSFSIVPLRIITFGGFIIFVSSTTLSIYFVIAKYLGRTVVGWTSIILSLYILGGLVMLSLGIVGEYVGKIYMEVKQRPRYIIEEKIG